MAGRLYRSVRGYLGGVALGLGVLGLLLFALAIPLTLFGAHFWGGMGFSEGPQPNPAQLDAAVSRLFWWSFWHRLMPLLGLSLGLMIYGFFEAHKEVTKKSEGSEC
jgi:hypothetical protein